MADAKKIIAYIVVVIVILWLLNVIYNATLSKPAIIGLKDGKLQKCPSKPNCVCS